MNVCRLLLSKEHSQLHYLDALSLGIVNLSFLQCVFLASLNVVQHSDDIHCMECVVSNTTPSIEILCTNTVNIRHRC